MSILLDSNNVIDQVRDLLGSPAAEATRLQGDDSAPIGQRIAAAAALQLLSDPSLLAREFVRSEADADEVDDDDDDEDDDY